MLQESDIIPYHLSYPPGERAIVLAPHPDDETLGCGGTIRLLLKSKRPVKVIFLTSGEKADPSNKLSQIVQIDNPPYASLLNENPGIPPLPKGGGGGLLNKSHVITEYALLREKEAVRALKVLGVSDYEFLRFPDRELNLYYKSALDRLLEIIGTYMPDTIYSPSMIELNPDHRTTAALSMEIQRINKGKIVFYEITIPLRPNILVDITSVYMIKKRAIKRYKSQLRPIDYLRHITALNTIRSLTVNPAPRPCSRGFLWCGVNGPRYVEAFWCVDKPLSGEDIAKWLSYQART